MAAETIDVFLLYNEQESLAEGVAEELRIRDLNVYFFRSDFPYGESIAEGEAARLENARTVLVLLGDQGWGPTQIKIAAEAQSLGKPMIPGLIGDPPDEALDQVGGLFRTTRRADLRDAATFDVLVANIRDIIGSGAGSDGEKRTGLRFDDIINTLVDGSDADCSLLLDSVIRGDITDSAGLAARLRKSLREDFAPGQETNFATAVRDPKRLASARSWTISVLIWLEPDSEASTAAVLDHIDAALEPERNVRFWTLAGVIQRQLPYLGAAISRAAEDPAPEVSGLAAIAARPEDEDLIAAFRSELGSDDFETAWRVLRILRIFPLPVLADAVCAQLERSAGAKALTYDALFALASPPMAYAALPILLERPGLTRLAQLVVNQARTATAIARIAFARVLSVFDHQPMRAALLEVVEGEEDRALVTRLLNDLAAMRQAELEEELLVAGYASDTIDINKDDIGIARDVKTLASVILSREVAPPLAIGLFGEWGSGKSFFMQTIADAVKQLAGRAKAQSRNQFCSEIVQINFNAWHYVDTSLWASLVSHILESLSGHMAPVPGAAEQQATLTEQLASAQAERAAAEAEHERATTLLADSAKSLSATILDRERSEVALRDLRASDLISLLTTEKELGKTLRLALREVGAPAALESIAELNKVVEESYSTSGRAAALLVSLFKGQNALIAILGIVVLFTAPPLIAWGVEKLFNPHVASLSALAAQVAVVTGSIVAILRQALHHAKSGLDALSEAKRAVDKQLADKRAEPSAEERELEAKIAAARAEETSAAERVAGATLRAQTLESRLAALKESQSLGYFIAQRSGSEDYLRHLGLISVIRKDFEGLVERLRAPAPDGARKIDRIVLYIDDVDRCPPQVVLDVLQAVHLLLAYELFVVVVSVDPRWLLRSLESKFDHLVAEETGGAETWGATSHDYLEKIFQIPFSVRPMNDQSFARLMRRLLAPADANGPVTPRPAPIPHIRTPDAPETVHAPDGPAIPEPEAPTPQEDSLEVLAESMAISPSEASFAESLYVLLRTPRTAKRFTNVYRLLKASLPHGERSRFEGTAAVPGEFQLPMVLLALVVGHSNIAAQLFPQFLANARAGLGDWWSRPAGSAKDGPEHARLREEISLAAQTPLFPSSPRLVVEWLPRVARYSFTTAGMFLDERWKPPSSRPRPELV